MREESSLEAEQVARLMARIDEMNWFEAVMEWKSYCSAQVRRLLRTERYADPDEPAWLRGKKHDLIAGYGQAAYKADQDLEEFMSTGRTPNLEWTSPGSSQTTTSC